MRFSDVVARAVSVIGGALIVARRARTPEPPPAVGAAPAIPKARPQGIPTLKMPTARGWKDGRMPVAAPGLRVNAYATGLKHPRWLYVLPDERVLVAEALQEEGRVRSIFDYAMVATMKRAAALGRSANRITALADRDGDGKAEQRETFLDGLNQPFGMALVGRHFYVGNTDGVVAFDLASGRAVGPGHKIVGFKPGGHWTRSLLASADGRRLYAGVGSLTNIADKGLGAEEGRAAIWEIDLEKHTSRVFASGLRNPVGMAWEPGTDVLWTVVNERDGLGDETPPDYLTQVEDGGFYGWPWCYWDRVADDRVPANPDKVATARTPDYALGGHTASLGLCWMPAGTLPGFGDGMVVGQHGSWNRSKLSGYRVVFVPFQGGRPSGPPRDILWGFLSDDERESFGRPVGVAIGPDRALLVADDVGNVVWRVTGA